MRIHQQILPAGFPNHERDHGDQHLSDRCREERHRHSTRLEARDKGADESDGDHSQIHQVHGTVADDASGGVDKEEDEPCHACNADGGSVRNRAPLSCYKFGPGSNADDST